jgi:hypothetical protein
MIKDSLFQFVSNSHKKYSGYALNPNISLARPSFFHMSIWDNMDLITKIILGMGFVFLVYGYVTIFTQNPPSPIDSMSFGLGLIGIALALTTMKKS